MRITRRTRMSSVTESMGMSVYNWRAHFSGRAGTAEMQSEIRAQRELNDSGICELRHLAERRSSEHGPDRKRVCVIEHIERFDSQFSRAPGAKRQELVDRQIGIDGAGASQRVTSQRAEGAGGRQCERRRIEPAVPCSLFSGQRRVAGQIGALTARAGC